MLKKGLRNVLFCTLIIALAAGFFLINAPEVQAIPDYGSNCAECHTNGVPGEGGGEATQPADKETSAGEQTPAASETPAADAGEEAAEEGGIAGLPLIIGGIVFIVVVAGLAMVRKRK